MIVAFIDSHGSIQNISHFRNAEGLDLNDPLIVPLSSEIDVSEMMSKKYWNGTQWSEREASPGYYYYWENASWHLDLDKLQTALREERDAKLVATDWTQMPDSPLSAEKQAEWASYRQALRDVPQNNLNITHINEVVWPTQPA